MISLYVLWIFRSLSWTTLLLAGFIISAAAFLRQLMNFVLDAFGTRNVGPFVWLFFAVMGAGVLWLLYRSARGSSRRLAAILPPALIFAGGLLLSLQLELAIERVHLIFFGLLGFLAARDAERDAPWSAFGVWLFCVLVASLDEFFQYYLPYRVGDPRDVLFGALGGIWGVALHASGKFFPENRANPELL